LDGDKIDILMAKYWKILSYIVVLLWFFLGFFVLLSHRIEMTREVRVIFAVFLFLYGGWRLARIITKDREQNEEN
jgi:positive regulator of sigma E activity